MSVQTVCLFFGTKEQANSLYRHSVLSVYVCDTFTSLLLLSWCVAQMVVVPCGRCVWCSVSDLPECTTGTERQV